jgi:hypothetical protein
MVQTVEPTGRAAHQHVPAFYSEPYTEFGDLWVVGYCECGEPLDPERVPAA